LLRYKSIRGTRDILPDEIHLWHYLENLGKRVFENYGYEEIRTPIFETTDLFSRSIGQDTDIVIKEMYTFQDRKGRSLTLRPEGTAGVIRAAIEHNLVIKDKITRLYYIGRMYRYERPQKGRQREFYQIGAEILGAKDPSADVEVIQMALDIFSSSGIKNLELYINSLGDEGSRKRYRENLKRCFQDKTNSLCEDCRRRLINNPLRVLDCKEKGCRKIIDKAPLIDRYLSNECKNDLIQVEDRLKKAKIKYQLDFKMVRGLDYYNSIVFEIRYKGLGAQDTVAAGGRYDRLIGQLGGPDMPAAGFALGCERVIEIMVEQGVKPPIEGSIDFYMVSLGEDALKAACEIAGVIRERDISTTIDFSSKSLKSQMRQAHRANARFVLIIGEEEVSRDRLIVKNMETGKQRQLSREELLRYIRNGASISDLV